MSEQGYCELGWGIWLTPLFVNSLTNTIGWQQIIKNNLYGAECVAKAENAKKSNFADQLKLLQNNAATIDSEGTDGGTGSTNEYNDIFGDPDLFKNFGGFDN